MDRQDFRAGQFADLPCADQVEHGEEREHLGDAERRADPFGDERAAEAAIVPMPAMRPKFKRAVWGIESLGRDEQKPDPSIGPSPEIWR
jgi:hypothetical protein